MANVTAHEAVPLLGAAPLDYFYNRRYSTTDS